MEKFQIFAQDESGVTAIEYAVIAGAVALVLIGTMPGLKAPLEAFFKSLNDGFDKVAPAASP